MKTKQNTIQSFLVIVTVFWSSVTFPSMFNPQENIPKSRPAKLQIGRKLDQATPSQCKKWQKRCYTQRVCQKRYETYCYECRKYTGYSSYRTRKVCNLESVKNYHKQGYWCYRFGNKELACEYVNQKVCNTFCYQRAPNQ